MRSASADKGKPGQTPVAQGGDAAHVPVHVRIHWHESVFVTFCKDFLLLSNEFVIKQKLKPQISKLTHVPFCTDLQTLVAQLKGSGLRHPPNVRVFSSRPEKDVRTKEAKLTMILEFYQYI